jgi:uncharacterized coiled-coil protein SlyX
MNNVSNNLRIDPSAIAQACMIALLVALTGTVLQLRQDVALLRDQMTNLVVSKEFAAFKAITEQHDQQLERRINNLERQLEHRK